MKVKNFEKKNNPIEILKNGGSIGYGFNSYIENFYAAKYCILGNLDGIQVEAEEETTPVLVVVNTQKFTMFLQTENGLYPRIEGLIKNIVTNNDGVITLIEGISADLTFENDTPFRLEFNKEPVLPMNTTDSFALVSVIGNEMSDLPILMQWGLNQCIYHGEVSLNH